MYVRGEANNSARITVPCAVTKPIEGKFFATASTIQLGVRILSSIKGTELPVSVYEGFQKCNTLLHHTNTAHTEVGEATVRLSTRIGMAADRIDSLGKESCRHFTCCFEGWKCGWAKDRRDELAIVLAWCYSTEPYPVLTL